MLKLLALEQNALMLTYIGNIGGQIYCFCMVTVSPTVLLSLMTEVAL